MSKAKKAVLLIVAIFVTLFLFFAIFGVPFWFLVGSRIVSDSLVHPDTSNVVTEEISSLNIPSDWLTYTYTESGGEYSWQIRHPKDMQVTVDEGYVDFTPNGTTTVTLGIFSTNDSDGYLDSHKGVNRELLLHFYVQGMQANNHVPTESQMKITLLKNINGMEGLRYKWWNGDYPLSYISLFHSQKSGFVDMFRIRLLGFNNEQNEINEKMLSTFIVK